MSAPSYGSTSGMLPAVTGTSGDLNGTIQGGAPMSGYGYGGKGGTPSGGKGGMPSGMGGYTSSPYGASNYGAGFMNPNTLPMGYGNSVSGWGSPSMTGDGFSWYGGQAPLPEGGAYNQMAQMMAGPSYSPAGSNWYSMAPGMTANFGPYAGGGKGSSPYGGGKGGLGYLGTPNPYQPLSSYGYQSLGNQVPAPAPSTASSTVTQPSASTQPTPTASTGPTSSAATMPQLPGTSFSPSSMMPFNYGAGWNPLALKYASL